MKRNLVPRGYFMVVTVVRWSSALIPQSEPCLTSPQVGDGYSSKQVGQIGFSG